MHLSDDHHLLTIQRLRFGCSQNAERWQLITEYLGAWEEIGVKRDLLRFLEPLASRRQKTSYALWARNLNKS